ncbi:hypothetical protein HC891_16415, partial [Candidatus Gracilibacteria bacterium]|nr:hypothetical protein [Candidatus Gracilibacteria bacterium]
MSTSEMTSDARLTLFERHVKQALKLYDQPERLGRDSPLASAYVLGRALRNAPRPITEASRGAVLRQEL